MKIAYYIFLVCFCAFCTYHNLAKTKKDYFWIWYGIFATLWNSFYLSEYIYKEL